MKSDSWRLLRAIFIICSSTAICFIAYLLTGENTKMFTAGLAIVGLIGIITGIIMGCVALWEHTKKKN